MDRRLSMPLYGLAIFAFFAFVGCTPPAANKPEGPSSGSGAGSGAGTGRSRQDGQPSGRSSLEDLRRGQSPTTPVSSPLKEIYFDFDRYSLRRDARATLKANADWLKANPSARVEIEGHCDERGTNEYNLALGAKRAQAAKDYLITLGVSAGRISTISYGEELPVCKEKTEECWQRNRRDRFVIVAGRPAS